MSMTGEAAALALPVAMAVAAGLVGCFVVMRGMALASDALSHVALPGIGVALALGLHPLLGAAAMLFFGALLVWGLERRTRLPFWPSVMSKTTAMPSSRVLKPSIWISEKWTKTSSPPS
jgi:ABC-type Mn2+/Zn2+ transport system permease subunit